MTFKDNWWNFHFERCNTDILKNVSWQALSCESGGEIEQLEFLLMLLIDNIKFKVICNLVHHVNSKYRNDQHKFHEMQNTKKMFGLLCWEWENMNTTLSEIIIAICDCFVYFLFVCFMLFYFISFDFLLFECKMHNDLNC